MFACGSAALAFSLAYFSSLVFFSFLLIPVLWTFTPTNGLDLMFFYGGKYPKMELNNNGNLDLVAKQDNPK